MLSILTFYIKNMVLRFHSDEEGIALTEYLLLLGLLTSAVILAVIAFGDQLGTTWTAWTTFMSTRGGPPVITP